EALEASGERARGLVLVLKIGGAGGADDGARELLGANTTVGEAAVHGEASAGVAGDGLDGGDLGGGVGGEAVEGDDDGRAEAAGDPEVVPQVGGAAVDGGEILGEDGLVERLAEGGLGDARVDLEGADRTDDDDAGGPELAESRLDVDELLEPEV